MFATWMKSIGETVKNVEKESVASDESSESAGESSQSSVRVYKVMIVQKKKLFLIKLHLILVHRMIVFKNL